MKVDFAVAQAFIKEGTGTVFGLLGDSQLARSEEHTSELQSH